MTCLRVLILLSLATALALAGCPGTTAGTDAGADTRGLDAPAAPSDDAFTPLDARVECDDNCGFPMDVPPERPDAVSPDDAATEGNAFISRDCGPADGYALRLTISDSLDPSTCGADPTRPSTMFYVHDLGGASLPPTPGSTITSTMVAPNGTASECPGGSPPCRVSEDWTLIFATYSDTGGASGQYTITWMGGGTSTGTFDATRCDAGAVICG